MDPRFVEVLRRAELDLVLDDIRRRKPRGASILEIGGGAGWQAEGLAQAGYAVRSFDVPSSEFKALRVFPVEDYDGLRLPVPNASFDIAFSSNALEHIVHIAGLQGELRRVLKPDGIAIHVVPSATWRLSTSLSHYPWLAKTAIGIVTARLRGQTRTTDAQIVVRAAERRNKMQLLMRVLFAPRHGERGNACSEIWHFSRFGWRRTFSQPPGWRIVSRVPARLYYTGYGLLDDRLPIKARQRLSRLLGSASHVYVLCSHAP